MTNNKWKFTKNTTKKMYDLLNESGIDFNERGGTLCGNIKDNSVDIEHICKGDLCEIKLPKKDCPEKEQIFLGNFHTHPHVLPITTDDPSYFDFIQRIDKKSKLDCIGYTGTELTKTEHKPKTISCYTDKIKKPTEEDVKKRDKLIDNLYFLEESDEFLNKEKQTISKIKKIREELYDKFYNKFNI